MTTPVSYFPPADPAARYLEARPEPIMIKPAETALIVVDMQNAYASPGGYLDHAGPAFIQEASLYNIEKFFGWVSSVDEFRTALQANINPMLTKEKT